MDEQITEYLHFLTIERGLSENTRVSYQRDLHQYLSFLSEQGVTEWQAVDRYIVVAFLANLTEAGKASTTITRMISSLRRFHQFLRQERYTDHDPMQHIDSPKKAQKLPQTLSLAEVERLIAAPDTTTDLGIRDRAILEVMYATGLRVSELIGLKLGDIHLEMGLLQTVEKGDKERIVPLGDYAIHWLERYLTEVRPLLTKKTPNVMFLFVNNHATAHIQYVVSEDAGATWSAPLPLVPLNLSDTVRCLGVSPGAGCVLGDGTLVIPAYHEVTDAAGQVDFAATVLTSTDHGGSWQVGNPVWADGHASYESTVFEGDDGVLVLMARNQHPSGTVMRAINHDWTVMARCGVPCRRSRDF